MHLMRLQNLTSGTASHSELSFSLSWMLSSIIVRHVMPQEQSHQRKGKPFYQSNKMQQVNISTLNFKVNFLLCDNCFLNHQLLFLSLYIGVAKVHTMHHLVAFSDLHCMLSVVQMQQHFYDLRRNWINTNNIEDLGMQKARSYDLGRFPWECCWHSGVIQDLR